MSKSVRTISLSFTGSFYNKLVLPFPVKIYPIEIFTRATPGSSLVHYSAVLSKWEIFIKMRVAESLPSFDIEQSFINQKVLFLYKNNLLLSEKPSKVPFSMRIHGFMTFLLLHFVSSKGERREKWQQGHKWAAAASALSLKLMQFSLRGRGGHTNGQIEQNCAINYGIQWNATNKSITKYENLFGVKSIFESIQRFARYRIGALILIGRLWIIFPLYLCFTVRFLWQLALFTGFG